MNIKVLAILAGTLLFNLPLHAANLPFYAFENGTRFGPVEEQAKVVKKLGYDGIGSASPTQIPEKLKAYDAAGIKLFSLYVGSRIKPDGTWFDPNVIEAIRQLKDRETMIELNIQGRLKDKDDEAVKIVREVADLAKQSGLKVVLYPHAGFYVASVGEALRIAKKSERDNVGIIFNLCHFLKVEPQNDLKKTLEEAKPYLWRVSTCGADQGGTDWKSLIQTLDQGSFDQTVFLKMLKDVGFKGAVGLQCYAVPGDKKENLKRSIEAWKKLNP